MIYEGMHTGAGVAASVLGIPAAAYAIALASFIYGRLHSATVSYQRDTWLQRNRTPPEGNGLLAAALINPAPPSPADRWDWGSDHSDPVDGLQRAQRRSPGMAGWSTYPATDLSHPRHGVIRRCRGTQPCDR